MDICKNSKNTVYGFIKFLSNGNLYIDNNLIKRLGYNKNKVKTIYDFIDNLVVPNDRSILERTLEGLKADKQKAELNIHIIASNRQVNLYFLALRKIENEIIGYLEKVETSGKQILNGDVPPDFITKIQKLINKFYAPVVLLNEAAEIIYANNSSQIIFKEKPENIIGEKVYDFITFEDRKRMRRLINRIINEKNSKIYIIEIELSNPNKENKEYVESSLLWVSYQDYSYILMIMRDITKRKKRNEKIKALLEEKSMILKEMHHRIKNNYQFLLSMLKMQENQSSAKDSTRFIEGIRSRIKSMAYIHEQLYNVKYRQLVNSKIFMGNLINNLYSEIRLNNNFEIMTIIDNVKIYLDNMFYIGLIINELVMNSIFHSNVDSRKKCIISISLRKKSNEEAEIIVSDNGIGISSDIDIENPKTMGLKLVSIFTKQLNGKLSIKVDGGTTVSVVFPLNYFKDNFGG